METKLSKKQEQFIIENINDKLTKLCIPAKVHSLEYDEKTGNYHFKSDEFNTIPSLFKKVFVLGYIYPKMNEVKGIKCIDYITYIEYHFKYYDGGENGANIMYTTYRLLPTDDYQSIRELSR